ncbi:MAG: hypothetical protein ACLQKY_14985 [Terracidiphilus sp.]
MIQDRDAIFNAGVIATMETLGVRSKRTSFKSPWQDGIVERFVGCCRSDLLDHVIVLNGRRLKRPMWGYVRHFHEDRTHLGLAKDTPTGRLREPNPSASCRVVASPKVGGWHHRDQLAACAAENLSNTGTADRSRVCAADRGASLAPSTHPLTRLFSFVGSLPCAVQRPFNHKGTLLFCTEGILANHNSGLLADP